MVLLLVAASVAQAKPLAIDDVPEPLKPWVGWVLHEHTDIHCPVMYSDDTRACLWPGELVLEVGAKGVDFTQSLTVYREADLRLPGDRAQWPRDVRSGGALLSVVERNGSPSVRLLPGEHQLTGTIPWVRMPASLALGNAVGIVRYRLNGQVVRHPVLREGRLWLRTGGVDSREKEPEERINLEIYRLVQDGHPGEVITHLAIEVSGQQREVVLGNPLLEGAIPLRIESGLPARLEADGRLRVQVRPGSWQIRVHTRIAGNFSELKPRIEGQAEDWPADEVWVYKASPKDRLTEITGVTSVDPRQVRLPPDWTNLPAYVLDNNDVFRIDVIRRGDPQPEPDSLSLARDLWLDFDGRGYTLRDRISGRMTSGWRLEVDEAFDVGQVTIDGAPQFITTLAGDGRKGVEVRRGELNLLADSRFVGDIDQVPAIGWGRDFQRVTAKLHLPPGYQLMAVTGVDNVPASWVQKWTLYDLFLVLIISIALGKLWGWRWAPVSLVTLVLTWHEAGAPQMIWIFLLVVVALLRVIPTENRAYSVLRLARHAGLLALLVIALPFMAQQARDGLYPQLEQQWRGAMASRPSVAVEHEAKREAAAPPRQAGPSVQAYDAVGELAEEAYRVPGRFLSGKSYQPLDQVDPTATIQTGPGLPNWQWRTAQLTWNGPVAAGQQIGLYLLSPRGHLIFNLLTILLVLLLGWCFFELRRERGKWKLNALSVALLAGLSGNSGAEGFPSEQILNELEQRLIEIPTKAPRAAVQDMHLTFDRSRYVAEMLVQGLQETGIPLPVDTSLVTPVAIRIDDVPANHRLYRNTKRQLWVLLPKGTHRLRLEVYIPSVSQVAIPLPLLPHRVIAEGEGWTVDGIGPNGSPQRQLNLVRIRKNEAAERGELTPSVLPPFVRVQRTLRFGLQWEVLTRVSRESPVGSPVSLQIPVVPGASVVTEGLAVKDGRVLVNLAANQREIHWRSRLDPVDTLTLTAPRTDKWIETWQADIGTVWHVAIEGIPPVHHQDAGKQWLPAWHPWPGETVTFRVLRPQGVEGNTATIDSSHLIVNPGKRATDSSLSFKLRSSQGGKRSLVLPEGAELLSVKINGKTQPIRQEQRSVSLPVVPGEQTYQLDWRQMQGMATSWQTPRVELGGQSVNARVTVHTPMDRWTLWTSGPRMGPAVLFWSILAVLALAAVILHKASSRYLPLGFVSWLLLGAGLTQVSALALIVVVAWFFALHYRAGVEPEKMDKGHFNLLQVGIVMLSLLSSSILLWAVQQGLLGLPSMQIEGNGSSTYEMNWYQDRVTGEYPQAAIYSVPLLVYRALMMAWALWLAFSLVNWVRWGWTAFSRGGLWRSVEIKLSAEFRNKKADDQD